MANKSKRVSKADESNSLPTKTELQKVLDSLKHADHCLQYETELKTKAEDANKAIDDFLTSCREYQQLCNRESQAAEAYHKFRDEHSSNFRKSLAQAKRLVLLYGSTPATVKAVKDLVDICEGKSDDK